MNRCRSLRQRTVAWTLLTAAASAATALGAAASPPASGPEPDPVEIPLHVVLIRDDDGGRSARCTPDGFLPLVAAANGSFAPAGVRFSFNPANDWEVLDRTDLNNLSGTSQPDWGAVRSAANEVAALHPGKLLVIMRHGPGPHANAGGFSWWDYNFVVVQGCEDIRHCGEFDDGMLAHEIGHYLGLPHTFAGDPHETIEAAEERLRSAGGGPEVFDGDGFDDTPPDPGLRIAECDAAMTEVTLNGERFVLPRRNLMAYFRESGSLTPQQVERVRWVLNVRRANGMAMPANVPARADRTRVEFESMEIDEAVGAAPSVQPMHGFAHEGWSGGEQVFFGGSRECAVRFRFRVERAGRYELTFYGTHAPDYATIAAKVNGSPPGGRRFEFDGYGPIVVPSGPQGMGIVWLREGENSIDFRVRGKDAASDGYKMGLDALEWRSVR